MIKKKKMSFLLFSLGLGRKLAACLYGRFDFDGIVTVQRSSDRMMNLLLFRYNTGDGAKGAQS